MTALTDAQVARLAYAEVCEVRDRQPWEAVCPVCGVPYKVRYGKLVSHGPERTRRCLGSGAPVRWDDPARIARELRDRADAEAAEAERDRACEATRRARKLASAWLLRSPIWRLAAEELFAALKDPR